MKYDRHICLLGFSSTDEQIVKSIIKNNQQYDIHWVSAKNPDLDGIIINASFLFSASIEKYLEDISCPIVSVYQTDMDAQASQQKNIIAIDLRQRNPNNLPTWLATLFPPIQVSSTDEETFIYDHFPPSTEDTSNSESNKNSEYTITTTQIIPSYNALERTNNRSYNELLATIKDKDNLTIQVQSNEQITWIKPAQGIVFINYPRESIPSIDQWQTHSTPEPIPDTARQLQLDLWLFETLWQAQLSLDEEIEEHQYYRLIRWPQPLGKEGRSQALRLAAYAQAYPVNLDILHQKTDYDYNIIRQFLFATTHAGYAQAIKRQQSSSTSANKSKPSIKDIEKKRSLLGRLRQKLGL